ncbi:hypothetical protein Tco_1492864 [Tanacetum coccineum]
MLQCKEFRGQVQLHRMHRMSSVTTATRRVIMKGRVQGQEYDSNCFKEQMLLAKKDEAGIYLIDAQNDFLLANVPNSKELEELNAICIMMAHLQSINNDSDIGPSYDCDFANENNDDQIDSNIIFDDPNVEGNSEHDTQDNNVHDQIRAKFELLIQNVQLEAEKTHKICNAFQDENDLLKTELENYKAGVRIASSHNQAIVDASSENLPSMLEKGSYVPCRLRKKFMRLVQMDKAEIADLKGDGKKWFEADIDAMNAIMLGIRMTFTTQ